MLRVLIGQRRMQRDEVGPRQQLVQLDLLDAEFLRPLVRQKRIEGDDPHLQTDGPVGNDSADVAATDDAERLVEELRRP